MRERLDHAVRAVHHEEGGLALAVVVLLGMLLLMVTSMVVARGTRQLGNAGVDEDFEAALHVADAGLSDGLAQKHIDSLATTGDVAPVFATPDEERDWVLQAAADEPVVATSEGEYAVVMPLDSDRVYAVGWVPSREATSPRVRVVGADYVTGSYEMSHAVASGGDIDFGGNGSTVDLGGNHSAGVHSNGAMSIGNGAAIDGCVSWADPGETKPAEGSCPPSPVPEIPMPLIDPRPYYAFATIVLCPDGLARGGPAHPLSPDPTPGTPCDPLDPLVTAGGWRDAGVKNGVRSWNAWKVEDPGVFYVFQSNADGAIGKEAQSIVVEASIFVEGLPGWQNCAQPSSGNLELSAGSFIRTHPSLGALDTAIITTGDIKYRGGATVQGAIFANEQIDYAGGPQSYGPVLAAAACDTEDSPVEGATSIQGGAVVNFDGSLSTLFPAGISPTAWDEL